MKIDFEFQSEFGVFRDAIVLLDDHTMTIEEIEAMKQKRFNDWLIAITPQEEEE